MARRSRKRYDPAEAARKAAERERLTRRTPSEWGVNRDALTMERNADVQVIAPTRTKVSRVTRFDCFALLRSRGSLDEAQVGAVRRLESDIAIRFRVEGGGERVQVDCAGEAEGYSRRAVDAANRISDVLALSGAQSARLLLALCEPQVREGQPVNNWRATVQRVTGEAFPHGQVALVRAACENLREAWTAYDNRGRKAAA